MCEVTDAIGEEEDGNWDPPSVCIGCENAAEDGECSESREVFWEGRKSQSEG